MKRFLIPAFFVVDGDDNLTEHEAEKRVALMQVKANEEGRMLSLGSYLMLDEQLPNKEVPIIPEETEIPGTYLYGNKPLDIDPLTRFRLGAAFRDAIK